MKKKLFLFISFFFILFWISSQKEPTFVKNDNTLEEFRYNQLVDFMEEKSEENEYFDYGFEYVNQNCLDYGCERNLSILTSHDTNEKELKNEINKEIKRLKLNYNLDITQRNLFKLEAEKRWGIITNKISSYLEEEKQINGIQISSHIFTFHTLTELLLLLNSELSTVAEVLSNSNPESNIIVKIRVINNSNQSNESLKKRIEKFLTTHDMKNTIGDDSYQVNIIK
ncbi:DUF4030 domain-containing protein [Gracilibacillus oryzae]|uniref:DUF4030 domain-containing protein n=1 Tax=Gracilibacillus oryzae TaxID=1672701 RepID=A0A7C8GT24_9BACI|nr:DUF4030 domain-containing protein [Gracilibacillus oryzae]KAB8136234.1 DUF4030 domain-containing protein [Gracilibacillus oryzae]